MTTDEVDATEDQNGPEEAGPTRERILEAAIKLFAESGFKGTPISKLASETGLNKQLIYYYFGSKRGLYEAAIARMLETTVTVPSDDMDVTLDRVRAINRRGTWARLIGWEGLEEEPGSVPLQEYRREVFHKLAESIRPLQDSEDLDPSIDFDMLTLVWMFMFYSPGAMPQLTLMVTGLMPDDEEFQDRVDNFLRRLLIVDSRQTQNHGPTQMDQHVDQTPGVEAGSALLDKDHAN
ncbi:TetR/AcrR family transcriptional regulator [Herbiconiux sp. P16]|uniref:TetR/AcrR family transcriptional regulator n=1 Tax=Herbiconiux wuyangfengii TaxID=3342794 RepID=UPI0035B8D5B8